MQNYNPRLATVIAVSLALAPTANARPWWSDLARSAGMCVLSTSLLAPLSGAQTPAEPDFQKLEDTIVKLSQEENKKLLEERLAIQRTANPPTGSLSGENGRWLLLAGTGGVVTIFVGGVLVRRFRRAHSQARIVANFSGTPGLNSPEFAIETVTPSGITVTALTDGATVTVTQTAQDGASRTVIVPRWSRATEAKLKRLRSDPDRPEHQRSIFDLPWDDILTDQFPAAD